VRLGLIGLLLAALAGAAVAEPRATGPAGRNPTGWNLFAPCAGNCGLAVYSGPFIEDSMADVLLNQPSLPTEWDFTGSDMLVAAALSRHAATLFGRLDLEPEVGLARRLGRQDTNEVWAALYFRYRGFPWDGRLVTTVAVSTGLNYASRISNFEAERALRSADGGDGSRLLHFFSPEITFALPDRPDTELLFRFHHRSGAGGFVGQSGGGAHYGTVGLRWRF
jgi:hypothetical protein